MLKYSFTVEVSWNYIWIWNSHFKSNTGRTHRKFILVEMDRCRLAEEKDKTIARCQRSALWESASSGVCSVTTQIQAEIRIGFIPRPFTCCVCVCVFLEGLLPLETDCEEKPIFRFIMKALKEDRNCCLPGFVQSVQSQAANMQRFRGSHPHHWLSEWKEEHKLIYSILWL